MKDSSARILVIHSQEELVLAQEARRVADQSAARLPMENACV